METESKNKVNESQRPEVDRDMDNKEAKILTKPNLPEEQPMGDTDDVIIEESCEFVDLTCDSPDPVQSDSSSPRRASSKEVEFGINRLQKEFLPPWELRHLTAEQKRILAEKYLKLNKLQRNELTHSQRQALNKMLFQTDIPFAQLGKEQKRLQRVEMEKVMNSDQQTKYVKLLMRGTSHHEALCEVLGQSYVQGFELTDLLLNDSTDLKNKPVDWNKDFVISVTRQFFPSPADYSQWTHEQRKSLAIKYGQLSKDQRVFLSRNQRQKMIKILEQVNRGGRKPVPAAEVPEQSFRNSDASKTQSNAFQPGVPLNQPQDNFWPGCLVKAKQTMFGWAQENVSINNQFQPPFGLPPVHSNNPFQSHPMNPFGLPPVAPDPPPFKRQGSYSEQPVTLKRTRFMEESYQCVIPGTHQRNIPSPPQFQTKQSSSRERVKRDIPSTAEKSENFNLYIVHSKYPNEILTDKEMDIIENSILETVLEIGDGAMPPTFNGSFRHKGRYQVICADKFSKEWLFTFLRTHPLWPNASLKIVAAEASEIHVRTLLPPCNDDDAKILKFISAQNKGLNVDMWRVVERRDSVTNTSLTLIVDVESANVLRRCGKINFKMGKAEINIVDDQAERERCGGFQVEKHAAPFPVAGSTSSRRRSGFTQERLSEKTVSQQLSRQASRERSEVRQEKGFELPGRSQRRDQPNRDMLGYRQERVSELPGRGMPGENSNTDQPQYPQEKGSERPGLRQPGGHPNRDQPGYDHDRGLVPPGRGPLREHSNRDRPVYHQERGFEVTGLSRFREQPSQEPSQFDQERVSEHHGRSRPKEHSHFRDRSASGAPQSDVRSSPWLTNRFPNSGKTEEPGMFQDPLDRTSKNHPSDPWGRSLYARDEPRPIPRWDTADHQGESSRSDRPGQASSSMFSPDRIPERPSPWRSRPAERTLLTSSHPRESSPLHRQHRDFSRH